MKGMLYETTSQNAEQVTHLRMLADWLEAHPELPDVHFVGWEIIWCSDADEFAAAVRAIGTGKKRFDEKRKTLDFEGKVGAVYVTACGPEQSCELVQVGEEEVEEKVEVTPAVTEMRMVKKPIYESKCPPSILAAVDGAAVET